MCENEKNLVQQQATEVEREEQEVDISAKTNPSEKIPNYTSQFRGACLILFGILLSCYDWGDVGWYIFADAAPFISGFCGLAGVIAAFSDCIKDFVNRFKEWY